METGRVEQAGARAGALSAPTVRLGASIAVGAIAGAAWSAALRAYMAEIAGSESHVDWLRTFVGILLPGMLVGAAIGASAALDPSTRRGRVALRWCSLSVLLFALVPMLLPGQLWALLTTGLGGGAVAVALGGLAGGYALGGGRRWLRFVCVVPALVLVVGIPASVPAIGGDALAPTSPRGVWVMLLAATLMVVLMAAVAIPFRRLRAIPSSTVRLAP